MVAVIPAFASPFFITKHTEVGTERIGQERAKSITRHSGGCQNLSFLTRIRGRIRLIALCTLQLRSLNLKVVIVFARFAVKLKINTFKKLNAFTMKKLTIYILSFLIVGFTACKTKTTINQEEAGEVITDYLKANPEYKTTRFNFGEIKFNSTNDMFELGKYKTLASKGLVTLDLKTAKKKFLSKDSSFVYQITLTDKASPLVLKQDRDKATVKVVEYILADEKPVDFLQVNSSTAKVTVSLKMVTTDFEPFDKDGNKNSNFITKTYKLKLSKDEGWKVQQ